jgi:FkbM family methyltransferase
LWVRAAAPLVKRLPFARYRVANALARSRPETFVGRLPDDLGGWQFHCDLTDAIAREVCFTGRYEPQETQIAASIVRPGDTVVDVGANWGYFTLAARHWTGPSGRVLALEPEPQLFRTLTSNVEMNALANVVALQVAAGAADGEIGFVAYGAGEENRGVSRAASAGERTDFRSRVTPLDELLDARGVPFVWLLKMDIEGAEYDALRGMARGLSRGRYAYLLLECHPALLAARGVSLAETLAPLLKANYTLLSIRQSPALYNRAARTAIPVGDLLEPFDVDAPGPWPHVLAMAPSAPVPA